MQDTLLVSFGAVLGVNVRFLIYNQLQKLDLSKDFFVLIINTFASFSLGFLVAILNQTSSLNFSNQLFLFFAIGFLGSLSTFSTFVYELFQLCVQLKIFRALKLFIISLTLGIIALALGFLLGN